MLASQVLVLCHTMTSWRIAVDVFSHTCSYTIYSVNVTPEITLQEKLTVYTTFNIPAKFINTGDHNKGK